jgi:hypothetical protein
VNRVVIIVLLGGCGPRVRGGDGSSGSSSTAVDASASATDASSTNLDTSSDVTGAPIDCEASTPDCAAGCNLVSAHFATWDDPHVGTTALVCVADGPALDSYRSTWWAMIDGELRIITSTPECLFDHPPTQVPVAWTECAGTPDEPAACRYLCAHDVCPGEVDLATLQSCAIAEPCGGDSAGVCSDTSDCFMAALRDRTPGRYPYKISYPNSEVDWLLVVESDGDVRATYDEQYAMLCAPALWQPARRCRLADPQAFDDCMSTGTCTIACELDTRTLDPWLVDCVDEPAVCE